MINLLVASSSNGQTACDFYRGTGALLELTRTMSINMVEPTSDVGWLVMKNYDLIYFQRPYNESHLSALTYAKKAHKPIWIDYDDYFPAIPIYNPCYKEYCDKRNLEVFGKCCLIADKISVTTDYLANKIRESLPDNQKEKVIVIPNAHDNYLFPLDSISEKREKIVYWRGSSTHDLDLWNFKDEIIDCSQAFPDFQFVFIGKINPIIQQAFDANGVNGGALNETDILFYMNTLKDMKPAIYIAPLEDNSFNRAKSQVGFLEATYAGAASLIPEFMQTHYDLTGIGDPVDPHAQRYNDKVTFENSLMAMLDFFSHENQTFNPYSIKKARREILTLEQTNRLRANLIQSILK